MSNKYHLLRNTLAVAKDGFNQVAALPQFAQDVLDHGMQSLLHRQALSTQSPSQPPFRSSLGAVTANQENLLNYYRLLYASNQRQVARGLPGFSPATVQQGFHEYLKLLGTASLSLQEPSLHDVQQKNVQDLDSILGEVLHSLETGTQLSGELKQSFLGRRDATSAKHDSSQKRRGTSNSVFLNKQIMAASTVEDLLSLVKAKGSQFDFFNVSSALARVPKLVGVDQCAANEVHLDFSARALVDELARLMAGIIQTFDARGLANAAWAFGKLKYTPSHALPSLIANEAKKRITEFSPQNLSNMLWSFVYMHHRDEELLAAIAKQVVEKVLLFKPQELSNAIWAFASLEYSTAPLLSAISAQTLTMAKQFKEQELSNIIWALGKLHFHDEQVYEALLTEIKAKLKHFLPQGVSNVAWALATVMHHDDEFLDLVVMQCSGDLSNFDVQALSNLAWALATLGHSRSSFFSEVVYQALEHVHRLSPQNLSNILWACATLGFNDPRVLSAWAQQTLLKLHAFEAQGLSNSAWSFAKLGHYDAQLFDSLAQAALTKLPAFTSQGLSNMAWAFATVGHQHAGLFDSIAEHVVNSISSFNAQNCSVTVWAFSTLRHYSPQLYAAVLNHLAEGAVVCEPQNIANTLWAYARMGHLLGCAEPVLRPTALALLKHMNQQELCNSFWAFAVLNMLDLDAFELFCKCLLNVKGITSEGMHQAYHAQLMFHSWLSAVTSIPYLDMNTAVLPSLPEPLHTASRSLWMMSARDVHVSRLQTEVVAALQAVGVPAAIEWMTDDGLFSIDVGFEMNAKPVAVEVDGSHHFTSNPPHLPLSDIAVRRRLLTDRGWHVVNVSFQDWLSLSNSDLVSRGASLLRAIAQQLGESVWLSTSGPRRHTSPTQDNSPLLSSSTSRSCSQSGLFTLPPSLDDSPAQSQSLLWGVGDSNEEEHLEQAEKISLEVGLSVCNL